MVYGSEHLAQDWEAFREHPAGQTLQMLPIFEQIRKGQLRLDTLSEGFSFSTTWLRQPAYISMHVTSSTDFDFVFYTHLKNKAQRQVLEKVTEAFSADPTLRYKEREFAGRTIHQFQEKRGETAFYYFMEGDYWVGSFTGYLLEDVIRHVDAGAESHFFAQHPGMKELGTGTDDGRWWVNLRQWPTLMEGYLPANKSAAWRAFGDFMQLDWVLGDKVVLWSGFAPQGVVNEPKEFLDVLQSQNNGRFRLPAQLPVRTAWAFHWQLNQPTDFVNSMYRYQATYAGDFNKEREAFADRFLLDYEDFMASLGAEAAAVTLESVNIEEPDELIIVQSKSMDRTMRWLINLSAKVTETTLDSLYLEEYLGAEIRLADVYNLPRFIFGEQFSAFKQTFYAQHNDYLVLGNTAQGIRRVLEDWNSGQVLGKSVRSAVFLENTLEEGVCGWILQTPRAWNHVLTQLNPTWKGYFEGEGLAWRGISQGAIQFRKDGNQWFAAVAVQPDPTQATPGDRKFITQLSTPLPAPLVMPPAVVRNHRTGVRETLVQDSSHTLYLLDVDGNPIWGDSLGEKVVSDVKQIDFFNNGNLQYFFATPTKLYVVDRTGQVVEGFPVYIPQNEQIKFARVIDYDGSKRYRFAAATEKGNVYLFDKSGFPLEGWNPRNFAAPLAQPPFHIRVRGLDRMVFSLNNGTVVITNRRGELQDGFPVDLRGQVSSPLFVQEGTELDNTFFYAVSDDGELMQFNLKGRITNRTQLYKPVRDATFQLVPDVLGQTFLISRTSDGQIGFLDSKGEELFQKEFVTSGKIYGQFYRFGAGRELILVTDKVQEFSYVLDYEGNLINYRPLNNSYPAGVLYYDATNTFHLYTVFDNTFSISTFQP